MISTAEWLDYIHKGGTVAHFWAGNQSYWFHCNDPAERRALPRWMAGQDLYVSVNPSSQIPPSSKSGSVDPRYISKQADYIQCINTLISEFDGKDYVTEAEAGPTDGTPKGLRAAKERAFYVDPATYKGRAFAAIVALPYAPTLIVDSGGGYHCYWFLRDTVHLDAENRAAVIDTQHQFVKMNGADPASSDISRFLRVIGTRNRKPGFGSEQPIVSPLVYYPDRLYDYNDLESAVMDWQHSQPEPERPALTALGPATADMGSVRATFNATHSIIDLLTARGYTVCYTMKGGATRLARPGKTAPSVTVFPANGQLPEVSVHHSGNDDLFCDVSAITGRRGGHDAYSVMAGLSHNGDKAAAWKAAKQMTGLWEDTPKPRQQAAAVTEEQPAERKPDKKAERKQAARDAAAKRRAAERTIEVGNRQLRDVRADAVAAVVGKIRERPSYPPMYTKVGVLVRVVKDEQGVTSAQALTSGAMPGLLSNVARWIRTTETEDKYTEAEVFPPKDVAGDILNLGEWPGIPGLTSIVNVPVFGRDGTLHDTPGYRADTGLYLDCNVVVGDTTPTPERRAWAKELLLVEMMGDFPFLDEASRCHALAYALIPFVRELIDGPVPPTLFDAPTEGTGKGLLLNALAYPALGRDAPTMADANDEAERRKAITSQLMAGGTHITVDNINDELNSGVYANAWTQPIWDDRMLGVNRQVKIPNRMIWALTGNNVQLSRENTRRVLWVRLDANMERPHLRPATSFRHPDIMRWVRANRGDLVTACLILCRAWMDAGRPEYQGRSKGSFVAWAAVMGGIMEVIGVPGFLANEDQLFGHAVQDADEMADFITAWFDRHAADEVGISKLFRLASVADDDAENRVGDWLNLLGAKLTSTRQRGRQQQLGRLLEGSKDRVYRGFKVTYVRVLRGEKMYRLEDRRAEESQTWTV